jgi:outer membrane biosynthesis protein TonB
MPTGRVREPRSFALPWAFGLSVLIHLLLLLITVWFPMTFQSATLAEVEPEERITFSFAESAEPVDDPVAESAPPAPTEPAPEMGIPEQALPDAVPSPPVEPEPPSEEVFQEPAPEEIESAEELPEEGEAPSEAVAEPAPAEPQQRRLDVRQALRDFRNSAPSRPAQPQTPTSGRNRDVFVPDFSEVPVSGFGVGGLQFASRDYYWNDYGRQIYMAIWRAWHNRLWMTTDEFEKWAHDRGNWYLKDQTQVRFVIERSGQVSGIVQEAASDCPPLDASALDALAEVILPPLPADFPRDREVVRGLFITDLHVRDMRPVLGRYKRMGLF